MDLKRGDLVYSTAGHDKGQLFCILKVEDDLVLLANGRQRRLDAPKRKNIRHVRSAGKFDHSVIRRITEGSPVGNTELRNALGAFRANQE